MFGFFEKKEAHVDEVKAPAFVERIPRASPIYVAHMGGVKRG